MLHHNETSEYEHKWYIIESHYTKIVTFFSKVFQSPADKSIVSRDNQVQQTIKGNKMKAQRLFEINQQIKALTKEAEGIKKELKTLGVGQFNENGYLVNIGERTRESLDTKKMKEDFGEEVMELYGKKTTYLNLSVSYIGEAVQLKRA